MKKSSRESILAWFAFLIGGYNANPPTGVGRLAFELDCKDDETVCRRLLNDYRRDIEKPLKEEIQALKAKLYDAAQHIERLKR